MDLLAVAILVVATGYVVASSSSGPRTRFLSSIPKGYQILADRTSVAGIQFRRQDALRFAKASGQSLRFERDPLNEHDPNALKVIGISSAGEHFLGYVWTEQAARIAMAGLIEQVRPRLVNIYQKGQYIDIEFQVVGPKPAKTKFENYLGH